MNQEVGVHLSHELSGESRGLGILSESSTKNPAQYTIEPVMSVHVTLIELFL